MSKKEAEAERQEELEWLIVTDEGYKFYDYELDPRGKLQELLEKDGAKEHQQEDGSYILSYFPQGLYDDVMDAIKFQLKMKED